MLTPRGGSRIRVTRMLQRRKIQVNLSGRAMLVVQA